MKTMPSQSFSERSVSSPGSFSLLRSHWRRRPDHTHAPAPVQDRVCRLHEYVPGDGDGRCPMSYEWRHDGITLDGQATNTLKLENIQASHEGDYTVVITNVEGAVTSPPVRLW